MKTGEITHADQCTAAGMSTRKLRLTLNRTNPKLFQIRFQYILAHQAKMYWNMIWKSPRFVLFEDNLTNFGSKTEIMTRKSSRRDKMETEYQHSLPIQTYRSRIPSHTNDWCIKIHCVGNQVSINQTKETYGSIINAFLLLLKKDTYHIQYSLFKSPPLGIFKVGSLNKEVTNVWSGFLKKGASNFDMCGCFCYPFFIALTINTKAFTIPYKIKNSKLLSV